MILTARALAKVTSRDDPEKKGRLKLTCEALARTGLELPDWVSPAPGTMPGLRKGVGGAGAGGFFLPPPGTTVELEWDDTDLDADALPGESSTSGASADFRWKWWKPSRQGRDLPVPAVLAKNYPYRSGYASERGHFWFFDDSPDKDERFAGFGHEKGNIVLFHPNGSTTVHASDGTTVQVLSSGAVIAAVPGGCSATIDKTTATLTSPGGANVSVRDGVIDATAPVVNINAGVVNVGAGASTGAPTPAARPVDGSCLTRYTELKALLEAQKLAFDAHKHLPGDFVAPPGGGTVTSVLGSGTPVKGNPAAPSTFPAVPDEMAASSRSK